MRIALLTAITVTSFTYTPPGNMDGYWIRLSGKFDDSDPNERDGFQCWGMFQTRDGYVLEETTLRITTLHHRKSDGTPGEAYKVLQPEGRHAARILVVGLKAPRSGKIATACDDRVSLVPGVRFTAKLPDGSDEISMIATGVPARGDSLADGRRVYSLHLERIKGEESQEIMPDSYQGFDSYPELDWAGDLDRDGRIDLLIRYGYKEVTTGYTLFLSSERRQGEILRQVARYIAPGC